ncbi:MAG: replication initiation protein [Spirochaetaceae bacterium]|nr:replication initiation protein [Spirochaetaceae bacterium]
MTELYQTFQNCLPQKPYCTDDLLSGLKIRSIEHAIKKRYIQPNKPTDLKWLIYDVDRSTAHFDWDDLHCPAPNFTVMNEQNGHAHLFYGLEVPVYMQMGASSNPIRYVSSIDVALTMKLDADPNYAKLIAKNPLNDFWSSNVWRNESYTLDELADWLDLSKYQDKRVRLPDVSLGRNCNLFDQTRFFAYREIRKPVENYLFDEMYGIDDFILRCQRYAILHNNFEIPLEKKECETIGLSVGKWVYNHMSPQGFIEWAEKRRQRSIEVRHDRSELRRSEAQILADKGFFRADIAKELGVSEKTIQRMKLIYKHF